MKGQPATGLLVTPDTWDVSIPAERSALVLRHRSCWWWLRRHQFFQASRRLSKTVLQFPLAQELSFQQPDPKYTKPKLSQSLWLDLQRDH